jgi:hypothetical protein
MRIQAGPLITIICGLVIAAAGFFWHMHTARTEKTASRGVTPPSISQRDIRPSLQKEVQPSPEKEVQLSPQKGVQPSPKKEETAGEEVAVRDPVVNSTTDSNKPTQDVGQPSSPGPVAARQPPAQVGMSDADFKLSVLAFAGRIRVFEQSFDTKRDQIFDKQVRDQAARQEQMQELKAIEREKANEFNQTVLPEAQLMERELLRRLQAHGISVVVPPPPRGISMALGRSLLQLDTRDVALPGHRPVQGLASYLKFLANNLPD